MTYEEIENWNDVKYRMEEEGFHYCFKHYSSFNEINDEKFHELRLKYLESARLLEEYILAKCEEGEEQLNESDDEI